MEATRLDSVSSLHSQVIMDLKTCRMHPITLKHELAIHNGLIITAHYGCLVVSVDS